MDDKVSYRIEADARRDVQAHPGQAGCLAALVNRFLAGAVYAGASRRSQPPSESGDESSERPGAEPGR
jgi:hypothetical protein